MPGDVIFRCRCNIQMTKLVERLAESMKQCPEGVLITAVKRRQRRRYSDPGCWNCGAFDHLRRNCSEQNRSSKFSNESERSSNSQANEKQLTLGRRDPADMKEDMNAPKVIFETELIVGFVDSLVVFGTIEGAVCDMIIDTGSNITILRPDILKRVSKDVVLDVHPVDSCLQTVTG